MQLCDIETIFDTYEEIAEFVGGAAVLSLGRAFLRKALWVEEARDARGEGVLLNDVARSRFVALARRYGVETTLSERSPAPRWRAVGAAGTARERG